MATTVSNPIIKPGDRLGMTLFLAVSFHLLLILGLNFSFEDPAKTPKVETLDITLVQKPSKEKPEQADYLAAEDQAGGGNTQERVPEQRPRAKPSVTEVEGNAPQAKAPAAPRQTEPQTQKLTTQAPSPEKTQPQRPEPQIQRKPTPNAAQMVQLGREIARLEASIDAAQQAYSERPKPKYLNANTRKFDDANYLKAVTDKIERIGNLNYPDKARRKGLSGHLMMEMALAPDGSLRGVRLLRSSGHKVLDDAATRIVRLAAPFPEVPGSVLDERNELRIVRTWVFTSRNHLISQ